MAAYIIANYDIHDPEMWTKYVQLTIPNVMAAGGKLLTATPEFVAVEGQPQQVSVVIEFESMVAAKRGTNQHLTRRLNPCGQNQPKGGF